MKKFIVSILMIFSISAYAYDPATEAKQAMNNLTKIDCSKSLDECRYYATLEYVAFFGGCRTVIEKYESRKISDKEWAEATYFIKDWSIWKDSKLKQAALNTPNPLKERLTQDITNYLMRIPTSEAMMECERIPMVKENINPEDMSDILQNTINYYEWRRSRGDKFIN